MRQQRRRYKALALLIFFFFLILALYGAYSVFHNGNRWFASLRNPRVRTQKANVVAGDVLDRNGLVLASTDAEGTRVYQDSAEDRSSVVHILGDPQGQIANAVETFQSGYLYGFQASLLERIQDLMGNRERKGDQVQLTIDARLHTEIVRAFGRYEKTRNHNGAAVVLNYRTGELLAEVSLPSFDPDAMTEELTEDPGKPFWNRATQSLYPPGSTFKIVTAASALGNLKGADQETFLCTGELGIGEHVIHDFGLARHGEMTLSQAFMASCNQIYAQLALRLGDTQLRKTAENFGWNENFLFRDLVVENSRYPVRAGRSNYEVAASGFGQSAIVATPMHMCLVSAAVANGGTMMEPVVVRRVTGPDGRLRKGLESRTYRQAIRLTEAETLAQYMKDTVTMGTATACRISGAVTGGKTGTADSNVNGVPVSYGWFTGYMEGDVPIAVCVLVEDLDDGDSGGNTAAVIAADIFRYALKYPERLTEGGK